MFEAASVIIGTYDDLDILETSLAAFAVQSFRNFEIVVADDGSNQDYVPALKLWAPRFSHGIQHVIHEKRGFRKARILNRAIQVSRFGNLIFVDMDCLPRNDFVETHLKYLAPETVIAGRRVHLSRDVIPSPSEILKNGMGFGPLSLLRLWLRGKARVIEHGIASPFFYESSNNSLQGSNFSVHKKDVEAVNGFNEAFEGWGKEDMELGLRLQFSGVRIRNLRNKVIQYHLTHPQLPSHNPASDQIFETTKATRMVRAPKGLAEIQQGDFNLESYPPQSD
ncbi:MAG: galactosyltransferase-related protein [Acidobacteriota bacterium]|nr:galactosyltransferase-related protein [Acidobacteriota bacterium]